MTLSPNFSSARNELWRRKATFCVFYVILFTASAWHLRAEVAGYAHWLKYEICVHTANLMQI
jgi:hypothetical protein